ncbi:NEL domain-containing protein [Bordetella sputigena]|uniref:NEL-type E3 ubiquitin ligase domain-containing protein n=1 Tax=Bordetella sputigena TaxID=1416810 RepID=UPI0039F0DF17
MNIPPSGIAYPNLTPLAVAQGGAPPARDQTRVICLAHLLHAVVTGDPGGPQLRLAEAHFRDLHATDYGAAALHQLRAVAEEHGCHPVLEFGPDATAIPMLAMPRAGVGSPAHDALRAVVAVASQAQLRLVWQQYFGLLSGTVANAALQAQYGLGIGGITGAAWPPSMYQDAQAALAGASATLDAPLRVLSSSPNITTAAVSPDAEAGPAAAATDAVPAGPVRRQRVRPRLDSIRHAQPAASQPLSHAAMQRDGERRLLGVIVEQWIGRQDAELAARWNDIALSAAVEPSGLVSFKKFLLALKFTHIHNSAVTREELSRWLARAAEPDRAALRAEAFRICDEGSSMCRDNALLTWNRLKILMLKDDVLAGRYAGELRIICKLGLDTLRMDSLEAIAQDKIIALHKVNKQRLEQIQERMLAKPQPGQLPQDSVASGLIPIDPIEIMLDYHVSLRKEFNLPLSVEEMTFTTLSVLTPRDIEQARDAIKRIEGEWFHEYLLLDFSPFLLEVRRQIGPEKCAEVEAELHAGLEGFDERLLERLRDIGASDDEQARRNMGVRLERELRYNTWLPHANAALEAAGLAPLPPMGAPSFEMRPWATDNA